MARALHWGLEKAGEVAGREARLRGGGLRHPGPRNGALLMVASPVLPE